MQIGKLCLNWKVVGGLAAVALLVFVTEPQLIGRVLPYLLLAACPLSMIFMMGGMGKMGGKGGNQQALPEPAEPGRLPSREEQLAELRSQLTDMNVQQAALEAHIRALETSEPERPPEPKLPVAAGPAQALHSVEADRVR